jgi:hypothetical protein
LEKIFELLLLSPLLVSFCDQIGSQALLVSALFHHFPHFWLAVSFAFPVEFLLGTLTFSVRWQIFCRPFKLALPFRLVSLFLETYSAS